MLATPELLENFATFPVLVFAGIHGEDKCSWTHHKIATKMTHFFHAQVLT